MTRKERTIRYIEILENYNKINSTRNWNFLDKLTDEELFDETKIIQCINKMDI